MIRIAILLLLTGCTLVVGTDPRVVGDAGECSNAACQDTFTSCSEACHGGPSGNACRAACAEAAKTCTASCE